MNETGIMGRLSWLSSALAFQRDKLGKLLCRLKGIGVRAGTSVALHHKFMRLMEQIAYDHEKEIDLISEIEIVEKRHAEMRRHKLLREADVTLETTEMPIIEDEEKPKRMGLLTLFGLLYFFSDKPIKHKNQDLTGN